MGGVARKVIRKPKPPMPAPAPIYSPPAAVVSQAQSTSMQQLARGKGRSSTILTGPQGLGDTKLETRKKSLLGG
tara:strand:+ start:2449 stop:2670 length:222 start_codon:yes stop_codon:yes gene_type:complete